MKEESKEKQTMLKVEQSTLPVVVSAYYCIMTLFKVQTTDGYDRD